MRAVAKCEYCGKEVLLPFRCKFCGGYFCEEHRLPEKHNFPNIPKPLPLGPASHPAKDPYALTRQRKTKKAQPRKKVKEIIVSEGPYHFKKKTVPVSSKPLPLGSASCSGKEKKLEKHPSVSGSEREKPKSKSWLSKKKAVSILFVCLVIGALIWYMPLIISYVHQNLMLSSYTKLTLERSPRTGTYYESVTFDDLDYHFGYNYAGQLVVFNSILEHRIYDPVNGAVYVDIGVEIRVSEVNSETLIILVKPNPQDYLSKTSFKKLVIANGQYHNVSFNGNQYRISYFHNPPHYYRQLIIVTPLFQLRQYYISEFQTIHCDLGLEIRVYKVTNSSTTIYVRPSY